ncbi:MAG: phosphatidate cytidylyltransferase [Pirellulaceae bacterium]|nr:phosphatidate cytidylyltransferase [Pirellulaceae bacterium]
MNDPGTLGLMAGVLVLLGAATFALRALKRQTEASINPAILETFRLRVRAWWILFSTLAAALLLGSVVTTILFGLLAFWALREFITLTPTRPGDHRTLFWVFFLFTPLQFILVGMGEYQLYSIAIPVYAFLFIPARIAMDGDHKRFLERTAKIQAGLLICVYCLSHAPALLTLGTVERPINSTGLLLFFVVMVQLSDVLQYAWAQIPSRHVIVPTISPSRTWEGLLGGTISTSLLGAVLWWATPFPFWLAAILSAVIALMGFAGGLTMSAIKRDRGVQDFGTLVEGHGGVLDRIDSICFAAPVFFHLTRWLLPLFTQ